jgi:Xaa-Pro aminopeptidase
VNKFRGFSGIRIEDNLVVTAKGHRIIGKPIPKGMEEVEKLFGK